MRSLDDRHESVAGETTRLAEHVRSLDDRHESVAGDVARLGGFLREFSADVEASVADLERVRRDLDRIEAEQAARPYSADGVGLRRRDEAGEHLGFAHRDEVPAFSDLFRGTEEFVLERMRPLASVLRGHGPVLDVGCGRGELLRVLGEDGTTARGVDLDPTAVARATGHGVDATVGDGLALLASAEPETWGAVVAVQVAEHLAAEQLGALFSDAHRALRPGGLFVVETVNPHSPAALKTFWLDLAHVRPLYPEALLVLARDAGYASARIDFPFGTGALERDLRTCGEYSLVATA